MATLNQVGVALSGSSGTGNFAGTTSPTLTTPRIAQINDGSGNAAIALTAVGSANYWTFANSGALGSISTTATGSDTNIDVVHNTKGQGQFKITTGALTQPLIINSGTSGQHVSTFNFANTAGTNNFTFPDASGTMLITGTAINSVPSITFSSTTGVVGTTTNDNAATGSVGEYVESQVLQASAVSLSTGTAANITNISLTAGDWDVSGIVCFIGNSATLVTQFLAAINTTSATFPVSALRTGLRYGSTGLNVFDNGNSSGFVVCTRRISISGTTTVYLLAESDFSVNTCSAFGTISARRCR